MIVVVQQHIINLDNVTDVYKVRPHTDYYKRFRPELILISFNTSLAEDGLSVELTPENYNPNAEGEDLKPDFIADEPAMRFYEWLKAQAVMNFDDAPASEQTREDE